MVERVPSAEEDRDVKSMKEKQRMILLFAQGWSITAIAHELQVDRKTVRQ